MARRGAADARHARSRRCASGAQRSAPLRRRAMFYATLRRRDVAQALRRLFTQP